MHSVCVSSQRYVPVLFIAVPTNAENYKIPKKIVHLYSLYLHVESSLQYSSAPRYVMFARILEVSCAHFGRILYLAKRVWQLRKFCCSFIVRFCACTDTSRAHFRRVSYTFCMHFKCVLYTFK